MPVIVSAIIITVHINSYDKSCSNSYFKFCKERVCFPINCLWTVALSVIGTGENLKANCAHAFHHEKRTNLMNV